MMIRASVVRAGVCGLAIAILAPLASGQDNPALVKEVVGKLNEEFKDQKERLADSITTINLTEDAKCYKILFNAYLELTKPPFPVGPEFNINTIHPKMAEWSTVSGWAESNSKMAEAILKCRSAKIVAIGLPYGKDKVDSGYVKAGVYADIGVNGTLRNTDFAYLNAVDTIAAFATAEIYRLMEAGQTQQALDLCVAHGFVVRLFCDREFLAEKMHSIELLSDALSNLRDVMYLYQDKLTAEQYARLALHELPHLRPDRGRLFMPENDRVVAEAMLKEVFDARSQADPEKFSKAFGDIQSRDVPLTRFGAAKRWARVAQFHDSLQASQEKLTLIYDDWWRRWRIDAYDDILNIDTQYERTNPFRYAAVIYSLQNVENAFKVRNQLVAEVNGTCVAAGLCGYKKTYGVYPDQVEKAYTQFMRKRSDSDPFDKQLRPLGYRFLDDRHAISTHLGRVWIEPKECILYGQGQDHTDSYAQEHTDDGAGGDVLLWPPIKSLMRAQSLMP